MSRPRYDSYVVCGPSGAVERWRLPRFITIDTLAGHLPHHLIFHQVRPRFTISTVRGFVSGRPDHRPVVIWDAARTDWLDTGADRLPATDAEALHLYRAAHAAAPPRPAAAQDQ